MASPQMSSKERMIAAVNMEPVDRLPFWPKLNESYATLQQGNLKHWSVQDFFNYIGCDVQKYIKPCIKVKRSLTSFTELKDGIRTVFEYKTPYGIARMVTQHDKASYSEHPVEHPIKTIKDIKILTTFYEDAEVTLDKDSLEENIKLYNEIGDRAMVITAIGESPLMYFVEHLTGVANAHYFLYDEKEAVEELFKAYQGYLCKIAVVLAEYSPVDAIYMIENTSTTLITPNQYSEYCFKHIKEYGEILNSYDRILALHMCGHVKDLLKQLAKSPAKMFEALTSPTVGNTSLFEARNICPDKCLSGGTNAILWMQPPKKIFEQISNDLDKLPHQRGIILSSGGAMPPLCEPDTIKEVFGLIRNYDVKQ